MKMKEIVIIYLILVVIIIYGNLLSIQAQMPDGIELPEGKDAWGIDQNHKTSLGGSYMLGFIRIIILSDGTIYYRKTFNNGTPATPLCQDKLNDQEMSQLRIAIANAKPISWQKIYGQWLGQLTPFRNITLTKLDSKGELLRYGTLINGDKALTDEIAKIANAIDVAGDVAFTNCAKSLPLNNEPQVFDKNENGLSVYTVNEKGDLLWFNHTGFQNGGSVWANNGTAKNVGYGWTESVKIFQGTPNAKDGIVYAVSKEGWLAWYKHNGYANGSTDWETPKNVGTGFIGQQVFSGGNGVIYLIDKVGDLYWFKHLGYQTGEKKWVNNAEGKKIGSGWNDARQVFSGGDGVIYKIVSNGDLYWVKHLGFQDGSAKWTDSKLVGNGWQNLRQVFSVGDGIIYAITKEGNVLWQKHNGFANGIVSWENNGTAKTIGNNWIFNFVF